MSSVQASTAGPPRRKQPNSRHCFVCGVENPRGLHMRFYQNGPSEVSAEVTLPEHYQGYPGVAHGGIVAAMLDEVASRAAMGAEVARFMVTASLKVRYRKPVPIGQPLRLMGRLHTRRGRIATASGELRLPDDSLAAEAEAVLADLPDRPREGTDLEALGWKVYPD